MAFKDAKRYDHPSYGMISISKARSSTNVNLFGSSIQQNSLIQLEISKAFLMRDLSNDWIHTYGVPLVKVSMSPSQFADMITSLNTIGVPCTINFVNGEYIPEPTLENKRVQFDNEFKDVLGKLVSEDNEFVVTIRDILSKPSLTKKDKRDILFAVSALRALLTSHVPFIKEQFTEQMDKTVTEARNEVSQLIDEKLNRLGLEKFKEQLMIELSKDEG